MASRLCVASIPLKKSAVVVPVAVGEEEDAAGFPSDPARQDAVQADSMSLMYTACPLCTQHVPYVQRPQKLNERL